MIPIWSICKTCVVRPLCCVSHPPLPLSCMPCLPPWETSFAIDFSLGHFGAFWRALEYPRMCVCARGKRAFTGHTTSRSIIRTPYVQFPRTFLALANSVSAWSMPSSPGVLRGIWAARQVSSGSKDA